MTFSSLFPDNCWCPCRTWGWLLEDLIELLNGALLHKNYCAQWSIITKSHKHELGEAVKVWTLCICISMGTNSARVILSPFICLRLCAESLQIPEMQYCRQTVMLKVLLLKFQLDNIETFWSRLVAESTSVMLLFWMTLMVWVILNDPACLKWQLCLKPVKCLSHCSIVTSPFYNLNLRKVNLSFFPFHNLNA